MTHPPKECAIYMYGLRLFNQLASTHDVRIVYTKLRLFNAHRLPDSN